MELVLVVPGFYPDSRGGAARQAEILAETLSGLGVDVTIVTPTLQKSLHGIEATGYGRIDRYFVKAFPNAGGKHLASFVDWTAWFLRTYGKPERKRVPIYVFHARLHALGPALAASRAGAPLLIKLGGGGEASDFAALRAKRFFYGKWVQTYLLRKVDRFVANGAQIAADLRALDVEERRIAAFSNGVKIPDADVVVRALDVRAGNRFVSTGRMVPDKSLGVLYDAARRLGAGGGKIDMTFLGEGSERTRLMGLAADDGEPFAFPGHLDNVYPELLRSDYFVSASTREGQSNSLLEAMSAGLIPIVYGASGASDVVHHGVTGFIVPNSTPEAFSDIMRHAVQLSPDDRKKMSMAAYEFAKNNISIGSVAERTLATFETLISEKA